MYDIEQHETEAAILRRIIRPDQADLPISQAKALLKLGFSKEDHKRMNRLIEKNQNDSLSKSERRELETYVRVGRFIDLLVSKARLTLSKKAQPAAMVS